MNGKLILPEILLYGIFISGIVLQPTKAECMNIDTYPFAYDIFRHPRSLSRQKLPCAPNQYFDFERGRCLGIPGGGTVVQVYNSKSCGMNELKAHCSNPNRYYICKGNTTILAQCPIGKYFANRFKRCIYADENTLNVSNVAQAITNVFLNVPLPPCTEVGRFPVPGYDNLYYTCESNGERLFLKSFMSGNGMNDLSEISACKLEAMGKSFSTQSNFETERTFGTTTPVPSDANTLSNEELNLSTLPTSFTVETSTVTENNSVNFTAPSGSTYSATESDTTDVRNIDNSNPTTLPTSPTKEMLSETENTSMTFATVPFTSDITDTTSVYSAASASFTTEGETSNAGVRDIEESDPTTSSTTSTNEMSVETENTPATVTNTPPSSETTEESNVYSTTPAHSTSEDDQSTDVDAQNVEGSKPTVSPTTSTSEIPAETENTSTSTTPPTSETTEESNVYSTTPAHSTSEDDQSTDVDAQNVEGSKPTVSPTTSTSEIPAETENTSTNTTPPTSETTGESNVYSTTSAHSTSEDDQSTDVDAQNVEGSKPTVSPTTSTSEIPAESENTSTSTTPPTSETTEESNVYSTTPTYTTENNDESSDPNMRNVEESNPTTLPTFSTSTALTKEDNTGTTTTNVPLTSDVTEEANTGSIMPSYSTNVNDKSSTILPTMEDRIDGSNIGSTPTTYSTIEPDSTAMSFTNPSETTVKTSSDNDLLKQTVTPTASFSPSQSNMQRTKMSNLPTSAYPECTTTHINNNAESTVSVTTVVLTGATIDNIEKEPTRFTTSQKTPDVIERATTLADNAQTFSTSIGSTDIKNAGSTYLSTASPIPYTRHTGTTIQSLITSRPSTDLEPETDSVVTGTKEFKEFSLPPITPVTDKIPALKPSETPKQNEDVVKTTAASARTSFSFPDGSSQVYPVINPLFKITQIFHAPAHNIANGIFPPGWPFSSCTSNPPKSN